MVERGEQSSDSVHEDWSESRSGRFRARFGKLLVSCRYFVLIPVIVLAIGALGCFAYGTELFVLAVEEVVNAALPVGNKIGRILVDIDVFLIGATLLIASFGLYELFVDRVQERERSSLPNWLQIKELNDLERQVISMIVLIITVDFVEVLVEPSGALNILERATAVAVVIVALTAYVRFGRRSNQGR